MPEALAELAAASVSSPRLNCWARLLVSAPAWCAFLRVRKVFWEAASAVLIACVASCGVVASVGVMMRASRSRAGRRVSWAYLN